MRDFSEFRDYVNNNCIDEINDNVRSKISKQQKEINFASDSEKLTWMIKTYSAIQTMELLKIYHEWLNS